MNQSSPPYRILSIALTSRGFGYAVLEGGNSLVEYGNKQINKNKNVRSLVHIGKLMTRYKPDVLVLDSVNAKGTRRAKRIKELHRKVVALAEERKLPVTRVSGTKLRLTLLGRASATKHEMAEFLAAKFPDELASRLPPERKLWKSEDVRMDLFDAVGLTVASNK